MAGRSSKTRNAKSKRRPDFNSHHPRCIITYDTNQAREKKCTTPDNADSEVFSDSRRFFHDFVLEKVILYGEVAIKSRYLLVEAKPLKFSPPKSLCGTVGSPWVSLATLFGFWETLIKFSESMILYGEKSFFRFFFFFSTLPISAQNSSLSAQKDTSIAGLRMFVAFLVFAKAPGM